MSEGTCRNNRYYDIVLLDIKKKSKTLNEHDTSRSLSCMAGHSSLCSGESENDGWNCSLCKNDSSWHLLLGQQTIQWWYIPSRSKNGMQPNSKNVIATKNLAWSEHDHEKIGTSRSEWPITRTTRYNVIISRVNMRQEKSTTYDANILIRFALHF